MNPVKSAPVIAGYCWTQLTDTTQEANGLGDPGRVPKSPVEALRAPMGPRPPILKPPDDTPPTHHPAAG